MADIQKYPTKDFSTQQTFLAYDPSQGTVRVSGQDIVDSIDLGTPIQLLQAEVNERVQYFRTTDLALLADLPISRVIYTTGASAENDGLGAHFVVVAAGTPSSLPMTNGNALAPVMQLMETISDAGSAALLDAVADANDTSANKVLLTGAGVEQAYRAGNILGTVSQSGGVPTGGVIQRGSDGSGEFVRFADGTQICTRDVEGVDLTGPIAIRTDSFPIEFLPNSIVGRFVGGQKFATDDEARVSAASTIGFVDTNLSHTRWRWGKSSQINGLNASATITLVAIGRWY